ERALHAAEYRVGGPHDSACAVVEGQHCRSPVLDVDPAGTDPVTRLLFESGRSGQVTDFGDDRPRADRSTEAPHTLLALQVQHCRDGVYAEAQQRAAARGPPLLRIR